MGCHNSEEGHSFATFEVTAVAQWKRLLVQSVVQELEVQITISKLPTDVPRLWTELSGGKVSTVARGVGIVMLNSTKLAS